MSHSFTSSDKISSPSESDSEVTNEFRSQATIRSGTSITSGVSGVGQTFKAGLVREKTLRLNYVNKKKKSVIVNPKKLRQPMKSGDDHRDFVNEYAYSLGIDPTIFTE